jgi:hypothetical protein
MFTPKRSPHIGGLKRESDNCLSGSIIACIDANSWFILNSLAHSNRVRPSFVEHIIGLLVAP